MQRIVGAMAEEAAAAVAAAAAAAAAAKVAAEVEEANRRRDSDNGGDDASYPSPSSSPSPSAEQAAATARAAASAAAAANEPFDFVLVAGHFLARDENIFTFFEGRLPSEADGGTDGLATFPPRAGTGVGVEGGGGWQQGGLPGDVGGVFGGVGVAGYGQFSPAAQQQQQQQQTQQEQQRQQQQQQQASADSSSNSDSYSAGHSLRGGPGMPPRSPQRSNPAAGAVAAGSASPSQLHPLPESPNEGEDERDGDRGGGYSDNGRPSSPLPVPRSKQAYVPGEAAQAALAAEAAAAAVAAARGGAGVASNASSPTGPPPQDAANSSNAPLPPSSTSLGPAGAAAAVPAAGGTAATGAATPPTPASADWVGSSLLPFLPPASLFTLTVGRKRSQARYFLSGSADVAELLMSVSEATAGSSASEANGGA